ncbi:HopJ type III effector protein [Vibrio fluvialis]|uniref:HopJ type III effector protein n=1 Tax=Vibrio fluvialis TaxID=676 RepID=UPI001ABDFA0B|nr:HopJ type III effector protein [Vibrio fluvialis]MBY7838853.1 HopJ type III effector protein [Vibrio fluvialis]MBY7870217.1 HopJ type III effector protein [Vibrio fluvialis]MBY8156976.1 HopJ type III effector protein [Vibrio fluvialis]MBY8297532.1 HopJ type III effector protein [Vibrio fluvialis]QTG94700.1 HopJ type III effector protein [Vibrio fluvialis]
MELSALLTQLTEQPENVVFAEVIATIDAYYDFTPTAFDNGKTRNEANQNNGSCKIFAFAQLNQLSPEATLACFGDFYRQDVLQHPENDDHQNIRNFIRFGWDGVKFEGVALTAK